MEIPQSPLIPLVRLRPDPSGPLTRKWSGNRKKKVLATLPLEDEEETMQERQSRNVVPIVEEPFSDIPPKSTQAPIENKKETNNPEVSKRKKKKAYNPKPICTLTKDDFEYISIYILNEIKESMEELVTKKDANELVT